jgi:hypothetical protein
LTAAAGFLVLALLVTLMPAHGGPSLDDVRPTSDVAVDADTPVRAPA